MEPNHKRTQGWNAQEVIVGNMLKRPLIAITHKTCPVYMTEVEKKKMEL